MQTPERDCGHLQSPDSQPTLHVASCLIWWYGKNRKVYGHTWHRMSFLWPASLSNTRSRCVTMLAMHTADNLSQLALGLFHRWKRDAQYQFVIYTPVEQLKGNLYLPLVHLFYRDISYSAIHQSFVPSWVVNMMDKLFQVLSSQHLHGTYVIGILSLLSFVLSPSLLLSLSLSLSLTSKGHQNNIFDQQAKDAIFRINPLITKV